MSYLHRPIMMAALLAVSPLIFAARLLPTDVTVGQNLETPVKVKLDEAAKEQLEITVTSKNPDLLLLSVTPELAGAPSIIIRVGARGVESPEFYVQGVAKSGTATYTLSATGFETATGTVTLAPSGFVIISSSAIRLGEAKLSAIVGSQTRLIIHSALLDSSLNYVAQQMLAGGVSASVDITTTDPQVGAILSSPVVMTGGTASAPIQFQPKAVGNTAVIVNTPHGFSTPAQFSKLKATVMIPGIGLPDEVSVGKNLQTCEKVILGEVAPPAGLAVTLTSDNPDLLLSASEDKLGSKSIIINLQPGSFASIYCMQALADSELASVTAAAPGYRSRTSRVTLTPSGILMGLAGPPDEAELFRKESAEREHGVVTSLASHVSLQLYTARLDPVTHRGADITVQTLRPGATAKVELKSSDPAVGTISSPAIITNSHAQVNFTPLSVGKTVVSAAAPEGFTTPGNVTAFTVIVK